MRIRTDEIVYVKADGNYCELTLTNGRCHTFTSQLKKFEDAFNALSHNTFIRVGRSLIVNKEYVHIINLTEQVLVLSGQAMKEPIILSGAAVNNKSRDVQLSRENLKELRDIVDAETDAIMAKQKGDDNG